MNIFLPFENIEQSVKALDDKRLVKQILECKQIYDSRYKTKGYANHPVVKFYRIYPFFVVRYAMAACGEYTYRFGRHHKYEPFFNSLFFDNIQNATSSSWDVPMFYCEGSANKDTYIRTTENVPELFQAKLIKKWNTDKHKPKWTKRAVPEFYKDKHAYWIPLRPDNDLWCSHCGAFDREYKAVCPICGYKMQNHKE